MTGDLSSPEGARNTSRALYAGLARLQDDRTTPIHPENNVLFPLFPATEASRLPCPGETAGR